MHVVEYIKDSYDLRRREKLQCYVQVFIADIELQELSNEFHMFTPLEANNFPGNVQQVLKLQNITKEVYD